MKIVKVPDFGDSPARVHRPSGTIYLNMRLWNDIPENVQKVILAHEMGHHVLNTPDEFLADEFAFNSFALSQKGSLKALFQAVTKHLDMNNPSHRARAEKQIQRIFKLDSKLGNKKATQILQLMTLNINDLRAQVAKANPLATKEEIDLALLFAAAIKDEESNYDGFFGKKGSVKKFFDKAGDAFRKVAKNPLFTGTLAAAGAAVGIPPAATQASIAILDAKSNANVMKARAEGEAKRAEEMKKAMAERNPNLEIGANVVSPTTETAPQIPTQDQTPVIGNAAIKTTPDTQATKKSIPLVVWIGLAVLVVGGIVFFTMKKG